MSKTYLATKEQLDTQNAVLIQINNKTASKTLSDILVGILDFSHDPITIYSGGFDQFNGRITT